MNSAGEVIRLRVYGASHVTDAENLELNGISNPLIAGYANRQINLRQVQGTFLKEAAVRKDGNTGRLDLHLSAGVVPVPRVSLMATWLS